MVDAVDLDEHLRKISELEEKVADAMQELELMHRAMATEPWIKDLPLDQISIAKMYLARMLAAHRIERLGCCGHLECDEASMASASSVKLAIDREEKEIDQLLQEQRNVMN